MPQHKILWCMRLSPEGAFGATLREIRRGKGLSQEELAFESGYHRTYISFLERGLKSPTLNTIFHLASVLSIAPSEIIQQVEKLTILAKKR